MDTMPCKNPAVCGVQSHRVGTVAQRHCSATAAAANRGGSGVVMVRSRNAPQRYTDEEYDSPADELTSLLYAHNLGGVDPYATASGLREDGFTWEGVEGDDAQDAATVEFISERSDLAPHRLAEAMVEAGFGSEDWTVDRVGGRG